MARAVHDLVGRHGLKVSQLEAVVVHGGNARLPRLLARQWRSMSLTTLSWARDWLSDQWEETSWGKKARVERALRNCPGFQDDPGFTLADLVEFIRDRYDLEFRVDPADFGVPDAPTLFE